MKHVKDGSLLGEEGMDLPWGDEKTIQFITNVGLITTKGPFGDNIMACEWTHHVSYSPGLIAVCIGPEKATHVNIQASKEFGVSIASHEQATLASIAGGSTGREVDKIKALEKLGYRFYQAKKIDTLMVEEAVLNLECKLFKQILLGSHTMFVGEVVEASINRDKIPIAYHHGKYGQVIHNMQKPAQHKRDEISAVIAKYRKWS
jgi:flavin reductase (DIM6/NTAB) family NADH-FMN oxidoreductase RutF